MTSRRGGKSHPNRKAVMDALDVLVDVPTLADVTGLASQSIARYRDQGIITAKKPDEYHALIAIHAIVRFYTDRARTVKLKSGAASDERVRLTAAQADIAEMNRSVMEGELIPLDWVKENYLALATLFRQRMMALPDTLTPVLIKFLKDGKRYEEVRAAIREVVQETAEEISALEIDYEERPLKYRASGRPDRSDGDAEGDQAPA